MTSIREFPISKAIPNLSSFSHMDESILKNVTATDKKVGMVAVVAFILIIGSYLIIKAYRNNHDHEIGLIDEEEAKADAVFNQKNIKALMGYGRLLIERGNIEAGKKQFERALEIEPESIEPIRMLGLALVYAKKYPEAEHELDKGLQKEPEDFLTLHLYALALGAQQKFEEAEIASAKALNLNPNECATLQNYGWILRQRGKYKEASEQYKKAWDIQHDLRSLIHYCYNSIVQKVL